MNMSAVGKTSTQVLLTGRGLAAFLTVGHTATDALASMLAALLPILQERFELTQPVLALLVATYFVSSSVMQPLFGGLADRLGPRLVGGLGVSLSAALLSLLGVVPTVCCSSGCFLLGAWARLLIIPRA